MHRGSYICPAYELRITERCLVRDLGISADASFREALKHPIVAAFVKQRATDPGSGKTVGPFAGKKTLYRLGHEHEHRGATWFDHRNGVVWLCAYGLHRSGEADDAFQRFKLRIAEGEIQPEINDYERLGRDRAARFAEMAPEQASRAVSRAIANEGQTETVSLARRVEVRVRAEVAGDIAEVSIAFPWANLNSDQIMFIVGCFGGSSSDTWDNADAFGDEPLGEGELGFRIWREIQ